MDFKEHKMLREFDLDMLEKKFKHNIKFQTEIQKLRLEYLKAREIVGDKRHEQRMQFLNKDFELFVKRMETHK